jgi:hypothetical protein
MFKEHKRTTAMITDDGPLSVENLYKNWSVENREWTRDYLKKTAELSKDVHASLKELFVAQGLRTVMGKVQGGDKECLVM